MKRLYFPIFLFMILLLTGCSLEYDIVVDHNKRVKEVISFNFDESIADRVENVNEFFSDKIDSYKGMIQLRGYEFSSKVSSSKSFIRMENQYKSLEDYQHNPFFDYAFNDVYIVSNNSGISFNANGEFIGEILFSDDGPDHGLEIEKYTYRLKSYNNILDHDADYFNESNNTLEWHFGPEVHSKNIYFKLGDKVRYDVMVKDFIMSNMHYIITIGTIIGILLIASIYFVIIYRKNNSI